MHSVKTQDAKVGDKLVTRGFTASTKGFGLASEAGTNAGTTWTSYENGVSQQQCSEGACAVCLKPGTEVGFDGDVRYYARVLGIPLKVTQKAGAVAIFRQINQENLCTHHDALEFPDGTVVLVNDLCEEQHASVLQLPAQPLPEKAPDEWASLDNKNLETVE